MTFIVKIDGIVADGVSIPIEDSSGVIEGAAGFENTAVLSATGSDYVSRKRVARTLRANINFGATDNPAKYSGKAGAQLSMRDSVTGRRVMCSNATFGSFGSVGGGGAVPVTFLLLDELQWL